MKNFIERRVHNKFKYVFWFLIASQDQLVRWYKNESKSLCCVCDRQKQKIPASNPPLNNIKMSLVNRKNCKLHLLNSFIIIKVRVRLLNKYIPAVFDRFEGIFDLKHSAIRWELRRWQIVLHRQKFINVNVQETKQTSKVSSTFCWIFCFGIGKRSNEHRTRHCKYEWIAGTNTYTGSDRTHFVTVL